MLSALTRTPRVVIALMLREMTTAYGKSPGGFIWVILEPAGGVAILTLLFSLLMRSPPLGINFPLFYATGMLPFMCYMDISSKVAAAIRYSKPLLAYPSVTFMDAILARLILNSLTQALVFYLIFTVLLVLFETRTVLHFPDLYLGFLMSVGLGFGVGVFNCLVFAFVPLYERVWSILTRPLFLISGIFYTFESLAEPVKAVLWYNPLVHLVGIMRRGFYPDYAADYVSVPYLALWIAIPSVLGVFFLRRYHRVILYEL